MENQIMFYIDTLFRNAPHTVQVAELREEILQNTLDRYHDLRAEGKSDEEAYRIAVSGIGDIRGLLAGLGTSAPPVQTPQVNVPTDNKNVILLIVGVMLCILSVVPPILLPGDTVGPALMFVFIAAAVALFIWYGKKKAEEKAMRETMYPHQAAERENEQPLFKSLAAAVWALALVLYFIISFDTMAWHKTWLIFPIAACVTNIIKACFDLRK